MYWSSVDSPVSADTPGHVARRCTVFQRRAFCRCENDQTTPPLPSRGRGRVQIPSVATTLQSTHLAGLCLPFEDLPTLRHHVSVEDVRSRNVDDKDNLEQRVDILALFLGRSQCQIHQQTLA